MGINKIARIEEEDGDDRGWMIEAQLSQNLIARVAHEGL